MAASWKPNIFSTKFLARFLIFIRKGGLLQLKCVGVGVNIICLKKNHLSFPNLLCILPMTISQTSSIMAEKKSKVPIYCDFLHFTSIIRPCGRDNMNFFIYCDIL